MPDHWSRIEVDAVVADYFAMLALELHAEPYKKAEHYRALREQTGRSKAAIEMKHQNISAILLELGWRYIDGYKPLRNYQDMLYNAVADRAGTDTPLARLVAAEAAAVPPEPTVDDILACLVAPPRGPAKRPAVRVELRRPRRLSRGTIDYVAREARNAALGANGERWVLKFERARLIAAGREQLADQVDHVAVTIGDGEGFDIRSFDVNGRDRFIEVKTTGGPKEMPFFVSQTEVEASREHDKHYHLYRPFNFRSDPHLFIVGGRLDRSFRLDATEFRAQVA